MEAMNEPKTLIIKDPRKTIFQASGATLVVLLGLVYVLVQWGEVLIDSSFVTDEAFAEGKNEMSEAVVAHEMHIEHQVKAIAAAQSAQNIQMTSHIKEFGEMVKSITLADAVDLYNNADEALYVHQRNESKDGATVSSASRRHDLQRRKISAKEYRDCVISESLNCEALRPR
jgi:hypothetical protein